VHNVADSVDGAVVPKISRLSRIPGGITIDK
jgi:hypothetical protein